MLTVYNKISMKNVIKFVKSVKSLNIKGTVTEIEKALINNRLRVSNVL